MARPSKYNESTVTKTLHYIDHYQEYGDIVPTIMGLAHVLGLHRETLRLWDKDPNKEGFFGILDWLMSAQENVLINTGLNGTFNPTICKLMLGKHGYHDRPQQTGTQVTITVNRGRVIDGTVIESVGDDTLAIEDS